jgi:hypothetical protein
MRQMSITSRRRVIGCAYGMPCQPSMTCGPEVPRPSSKRPSVRRSRPAAVCAISAGVRLNTLMIPVPSRTRDVFAARYPSMLIASKPYASATHTQSTPAASSATARAAVAWKSPA